MNAVMLKPAGGNRYLVSGPLQFDTVTRIREAGLRLLGDHRSLVLDLGQVTRADSAGVALLIEWMREARLRSKQIHFENIPEQMLAIARAGNVDRLLP